MDDEKQGMRELEENPPKDLEDWPDDERKYEDHSASRETRSRATRSPAARPTPTRAGPTAERNSD